MNPDFTPNAAHEMKHLETGFLAGLVIGLVFIVVLGWNVLGMVVLAFATIHFIGWASYETRGRDVYIYLQAFIRVFHYLLTPLLLALMYGLAILLCGTIARVLGMNRLRRDFEACRAMDSLLDDAPETTRDDFERQS